MSTVPQTFGTRLQAAVAAQGPIIAGIDPHASLLADWGLSDDAAGLREFSRRTLLAVHGEVAAVKPQSAFFERHGSAGVAVLEELLAAARELGILTILDVKRGDIGSTMGAYARTHLRPGAPLEADAITVSPFLGTGSLDPAVDLALEHGKGLFVLALTSNPDGPQVQHARADDGTPVACHIARYAQERGGGGEDRWSSIGLVVGATVGDAYQRLGLDRAAPSAPLLAPGFGAQGAGPLERTAVFGDSAGHVLVSLSRGLLAAGPEAELLQRRAAELRAAYA
ncbi:MULTISPECIES: orotidine-5'-phosphate decarboxylase [unclassified Brachybacterium]|uniref:orotidine-5'-phosphate decarboxylase n=1 Tax=unclassified Brachybacterium TaxID=2623841 RepID=UPI000C806A83|nr:MULTISPECIES: orotidine-5'-phosphate decarboxylase [unclassified Brachybacterium]PMC75817.1 orotidine-5'-phosphate decarboxylase [Brachybacterium sp. UMB0905]